MRRPTVLAFAALVVAALGCAPAERPNLLLVTVDTLRADRLACYGGPADSGRQLCDLFADGTRYAWAFSTAPYTAPAIASLLASRYPAFHGVTQAAVSYLGNPVPTLAETLREAGYATAAFVSNPVLSKRRNLGQGFDVYDVEMTRQERNRPGFAEREAEATTDAALAWLDARDDGPWFLWVHYQDPHGPYEPPGATPARDPARSTPLPVLDVQSGYRGIPAYQALPGVFSREAYERRYLDEIAYLEPHLLRLVAGADAHGAPELWLSADHGEAFGEDEYFFAHGHSLGLDQIRVPLLHRSPRDDGGHVVESPVSLVDLAPSLLALAGIDPPPGFQGVALPSVPGADPLGDRTLFAEHGRRVAAIQAGRYYSRDRELAPRDPGRALGQELPWLPPRSAALGTAGYLPVDDPSADPLEPAVSAFLEATSHLTGLRHEEVPNETLEQMRALGYVE